MAVDIDLWSKLSSNGANHSKVHARCCASGIAGRVRLVVLSSRCPSCN